VVKVGWDAVLTRSLERALSDRTEEEFLRTLSWLVARLDDSHGGVYHALQQKLGLPPFRSFLLQLTLAGRFVMIFRAHRRENRDHQVSPLRHR
jgi:hypothetical protein